MKKVLSFAALLCCVSGSFAINGYSPYKLYVQSDTVTHVNLDSNIVRPSAWSLQIADTLDRRFVRFTDFTSHDSTLKYLNVDSLRSGPDIDTINGNTRFTGSPTVAGTVTAAGFSGPVTGAVTGNATTATTATNQSGGTVSATTGVFSNTTTVDSLKSTKGINATGGTFSARITATDIAVSDSVIGATGTFSGSVTINGTPGLHGTGTTNTLTKFTNGATGAIGDSHISDDGALVAVTAPLDVAGLAVIDSGTIPILTGDVITRGTGSVDSLNSTKGVTAPRGFLDSLKLGSGDWLTTYDTGSFACTLRTTYVTVQQVGVITYSIVGDVVTLSLPNIYGESNGPSLALYFGQMPNIIRPTDYRYGPTLLTNNGVQECGFFMMYVGGMEFFRYSGAGFTSSGEKGPMSFITLGDGKQSSIITYKK